MQDLTVLLLIPHFVGYCNLVAAEGKQDGKTNILNTNSNFNIQNR